VPKANANRSVNAKLVDLQIAADDDTYTPTAYVPVATDLTTYYNNGVLLPAWTFTSADTSLFKCVP